MDYGTLNVAGNSTLVGALSVTGNIGTSGTLGVTGASTLSGALNVTGATTLTGVLNVSGASSVTGATTIIGDLSVGGSNQELRFYEGSNYVGFEAPALAADKIWVLPNVDGSADQVLKTDGSGNLGWTAAGGGGAIDGLSDAKLEGTDFTGSMIIGHQTTGTLDAAINNTAVGIGSLDAITSGDGNTAIGKNALTSQTTGHGNTASGNSSLQFNTTGGYNTASGAFALNANTTGSNNTALGSDAGDVITTGSNNVLIGKDADPSANNATNQIVIGQGATGTTDNTVLLGNSSVTAWLPGNADTVDLGTASNQFDVVYANKLGFASTAMTLPTADGSANQVLKTDGSGALGWATVSGGGGSLAQLTENSKTGYRLSEADANNYGEIGASAVDLSISSTASSTKGATGTNSFATNISTASGTQSFAAGSSFASGTQSTAFGYNNNSPGQFSFATGQGSYSYGARSTTLGMANEARGTLSVTTGKYTVARDYGTLVIGQYNSVGNLAVTSNGSGTVFDTDNSAFVIGNGESGSLSDAFVVYSNGNTTTSGDLSLGGSNKELRFYEGANYVGFEAPALSADKIWVLPAADGSVGQILKTDGSGTLSWTTNVSGASSLDALSDAFFNSSAANLVVGHIPGNITSYGADDTLSNASNHDTNGAKFKDWRLPTKRELNHMYLVYSTGNAANLNDYAYWSSTELDGSVACFQYFSSGNQSSNTSFTPYYVRAVRAF